MNRLLMSASAVWLFALTVPARAQAPAVRVEIVRGPPTPVYGPGKVGGLMNFVPKTARAEQGFITDVTGEVEGGVGAYGLTRLSGQLGAPVRLGGAANGGVYAYVEME